MCAHQDVSNLTKLYMGVVYNDDEDDGAYRYVFVDDEDEMEHAEFSEEL